MTSRDDSKPLYVCVSEAQKIFGLHRSTIYRLAQRGKITIYSGAGRSVLEVAEMEALIKSRRIGVSPVVP